LRPADRGTSGQACSLRKGARWKVGFSIEDADPGFGDFVDKTLTWGGGVGSVPVLASTESLAVQIAMRGAKLYSLELVCAVEE